MATVELLLSPLPIHVRTARLISVAAARRAGLGAELLDELRLAVGEACSRAVAMHAKHAPDQPVQLLAARRRHRAHRRGGRPGPGDRTRRASDVEDLFGEDEIDPRVSLAVIAALVDDVTVTPVQHGDQRDAALAAGSQRALARRAPGLTRLIAYCSRAPVSGAPFRGHSARAYLEDGCPRSTLLHCRLRRQRPAHLPVG